MLDPLARGLEADVETVIGAKVRAIAIAPAGAGTTRLTADSWNFWSRSPKRVRFVACTWFSQIHSRSGADLKCHPQRPSMNCCGISLASIFILEACCTRMNLFFV